jgi:DNA-binding CsgD family transcriptional regulator
MSAADEGRRVTRPRERPRPRERDVVELLLSGLPTEDVAARLHNSRHTVRDHVNAIFAKVGVAGRPELTARFLPGLA